MSTKPPKKRTLRYALLAITLLMIFFAFSKNNDYNNLKDVLTKDKEDLQVELNGIVEDYKQLNVKNKKLSRRVIKEINKIIALKDSVKNLKVENFKLIRSFRRSTAKLQKENRILISKVDSLNIVNSDLKKENILANEILSKKNIIESNLKKKNHSLAEVNEKLKEEIEIAPAREIKTSNVKAIAMKEKNSGKLATTFKHNRTDAFRVNFKLLENDLTAPGDKKIHIQVKDKKDNVIAAKTEEAVLKNDKKIKYSDELIADYKNEEIEVLSLILVDRENMEKGEYKINVFIDGNYSSSSIVTLK